MNAEVPPDLHRFDGPDDGAWLDALLRADAADEGHIDDAGFTARVMGALPARRARSWQWLAPALGALGAASVLALTGTNPFAPLMELQAGHVLGLNAWLSLLPAVALPYLAAWLCTSDLR